MEEQIIKWIAQRIKDEHRKHAKNIDNWEQIAARKIVATYNVTLRQPDVSGRSEQLFCECQRHNPYTGVKFDFALRCFDCNKIIEQNNCH